MENLVPSWQLCNRTLRWSGEEKGKCELTGSLGTTWLTNAGVVRMKHEVTETKQVDAVFLDFKKTFDKVPHNKLP
jgi:hypothetical protein